MLGTKWPSITSKWIQSAPAASTARTSSPSLEKSEARIDGAMTRGRGVKEADICAVFRKLSLREKRFFGLTCECPAGNAGGKICRQAAPIADWRRRSPIAKAIILLIFLPWHGAC